MRVKERIIKLKQLVTCLKCKLRTSSECDNCLSQHQVGTMCEIVENLEAISKILENIFLKNMKRGKQHGIKNQILRGHRRNRTKGRL